MGSRQLRRWLNRPLTSHGVLRQRYQALGALIDGRRFEALRDALRGSRRHRADPRARGAALGTAARPDAAARLAGAAAGAAGDARAASTRRCSSELPRADSGARGRGAPARPPRSPPSLPALVRDGEVIAAGYDAELDELRRIATHTDEFLLELERRERERTGLAGLKLGYNRVQGFFIEIARARRRAACRRTTCAARRSSPPSASSPRSSRASRTRCSARASGRSRASASSTRRSSPGSSSGLGPLQATAGGARRARCAGGARRARRDARVVRTRAGGRAAPHDRRRRATRWSSASPKRRSCRTTCTLDAARRMLVITGPEHGRQVHLHAPGRADRGARAHRQLRAGRSRR